MQVPRLIDFPAIGQSPIGYISVAESVKLPFEIKRVFWTYYTPEEVVRGRHTHYKTEQILVAAAGRITVITEDLSGKIETFVLEKPSVGLYLPAMVWHTMQYSHTAVQLALASEPYNETDYIRDYETFKSLQQKK